MGRGGHNAIDALLPREMAEKAEHVGVDKTRLDVTSLMILAILAGAFIAFGSMFSVVVMAGSDGVLPYGVTRFLAGVVFSLGLILVIVGRAELFTGNNLMVMACASGKVGPAEVLRAWGVVYVGTTTLIITHNASIQDVAHRVLLFADGRISNVRTNETRRAAAELSW